MKSPFIDQVVVVRTFAAGVHIGTLVEKDGDTAVLKGARRLWKWSGAFTLSEVATSGVNSKQSRMSVSVPFIELDGVIEVIPTTEGARETFAKTHE